jgi:hypothetical protein|tara:strand:- start:1149 stop:1382 length:234 start_codon:yes stop_codon:yes gene_type:complete
MTKIRYLVKLTAPCECCNNLSYGFRGNFETEEQARQWIVHAKISKDYKPEILPITIDKNYNDKILFKCEKQQNFSIN